jgi:hypothetical protein
MNEEMRETLREAALKGVRQLIGTSWDGTGAYCGLGWLQIRLGATADREMVKPVDGCHLCGATVHTFHRGRSITTQGDLLVHLNNDHRLDWLGLAEKMPVDPEPEHITPQE